MGGSGLDPTTGGEGASGDHPAKDAAAASSTDTKSKTTSTGAPKDGATTRSQAKEQRNEMGLSCWVAEEAGKNSSMYVSYLAEKWTADAARLRALTLAGIPQHTGALGEQAKRCDFILREAKRTGAKLPTKFGIAVLRPDDDDDGDPDGVRSLHF